MAYQLISVIVPAYNHAHYVERALQSVYDQTWPNIELILLDDCSTDDTYECARKWIEKNGVRERFKRITFEKNLQNMGAYATINRGLALAKGEWLTILNSDDWYAPERFSRLMAEAEKKGAEWLFGRVALVDENDRPILNDSMAIQCRFLPERIKSSISIGHLVLEENIAISSGNLFFTRALYERVGEFAKLKLAHDWDFMIRCLAYSEPAFVEEDLYFYRIHSNNSFKNLVIERYLESYIIYRRLFNIINDNDSLNKSMRLYIKLPNLKWFEKVGKILDQSVPNFSIIVDEIEYMVNNFR